MGDFTRGYTFVQGGEVNAERLRMLVESARLTVGLNRVHADQSEYSFVFRSPNEIPSPYHRELWLHELVKTGTGQTSGNQVTSYMYHLSAKVSGLPGWFAVDPSHVTIFNNTGGTISLGAIVMPAGSVTTLANAGPVATVSMADTSFLLGYATFGVATRLIPDGEFGVVCVNGRALVNVQGTPDPTPADRLGAGSDPGKVSVLSSTLTLLTMGYALSESIESGSQRWCDAWLVR